VIFAVLIGPLVHFFLPRLTISTELATDALGYEAR
jgi:hypothetical protein